MHTRKLVSSRVQKVIVSAFIVGGAITAASAQTIENNGTGTNNGYYYSLYSSGGSATMTFPEASSSVLVFLLE